MDEEWLQCFEWLVGGEVGGGVLVWWWVALYSLCIVGCRVMYKGGWWSAIYSMYRLGCFIYRYDRALLLLYSMNMSWVTIYSVGRVGDMRH